MSTILKNDGPPYEDDCFSAWCRAVRSRINASADADTREVRSLLGLTTPLPPPRPHVLYLSAAGGFSGSEQSLLQTLASLDEQRFQKSAVISRPGVFADRMRAVGVETTCCGEEFWSSNYESLACAARLLCHIRPDILHINSYAGPGIVFAAHLLGIPIVQHVRIATPIDLADQVQHAAAVIAVSRFVAGRLFDFGVPQDRVHCIYNPVDIMY
ncbi:MAG: glycosyltransferase [Acidobacteria bacterium]|nr:glycosyltransferase [Acidobacteriota bacterium]